MIPAPHLVATAAALVIAAGAAVGCGTDSGSTLDDAQDAREQVRQLEAEQRCERYTMPSERLACREEAGLE